MPKFDGTKGIGRSSHYPHPRHLRSYALSPSSCRVSLSSARAYKPSPSHFPPTSVRPERTRFQIHLRAYKPPSHVSSSTYALSTTFTAERTSVSAASFTHKRTNTRAYAPSPSYLRAHELRLRCQRWIHLSKLKRKDRQAKGDDDLESKLLDHQIEKAQDATKEKERMKADQKMKTATVREHRQQWKTPICRSRAQSWAQNPHISLQIP